jgi:Zn-dependent protease/CBS domain-containing protein
MRSGVRIARLFGVNIYLDWSWLFIFLLVTWNLAAGVFPSLHPEWSPVTHWVTAAAASLLFFASVLAHELAHAVVAQARGLPVRSITLFIFGGVANIESEPGSPGTEFLIAIVGPLTSFALGVLFLALAYALSGGALLGAPSVTQALAQLGPLPTLLLWLGPINIVLALFNLVPGFPLDGGRVLRSLLWAATGSLRRATRWAAAVGQAVAWVFIITGIAMIFGVEVPFFGTGLISGLWLAFIGWFLNSAAVESYRRVMVDDLLEGVPVARLMRSEAPTVPPNLPINRLVDEYVLKTDERAFPVVDGDRLVGLVCLEDVRKVPRESWDRTLTSQIMTPATDLTLTTPREDASQALHKLGQRDVRQIPVVQDGHLVGMLRRRDVLRWLQLQSGQAS